MADVKINPIAALLIVATFTLCALLMRVSDEDVAKCQATTNYSAERCLTELTR